MPITTLPELAPPPAPAPARPPSGWGEVLFTAATKAAGLAILTILAALVAVLVWQSLPALSRAAEFDMFTSATWRPKPSPAHPDKQFGVLAFVYGTVVTSAIAMLLAVPLGVAAAAFLSEVAPASVRKAGAFLIELLAAIPSVVYGFWGLFFLAPVVQQVFSWVGGPNTGGNGMLSAGLILAIMVLPYITAISFDVCQSVPRSQREGALAVGATPWQTIWRVVLPYARPGIVAACFLALGRALGETMAVTMLIGNAAEVHLSPFALGDTIASRIANQLNEADEEVFRAALVALGLVLLLVTAVFNVAARLLLARLTGGRKAGGGRRPSGEPQQPTDSSRLPAELPPRHPLPPAAATGAQARSRLMIGVLAAAFALALVPLFLILGYITVRGAAAIDADFFLNRTRPPHKHGGMGNAILGSVMIVGLASVLAVPIGLAAAVFLAEDRKSRLARATRFAAELLGGVPSIVIGVFAYALLVVPLGGFSAWAAAFALGVMMVPIVVRSAEESMKLVPDAIRQASYALGASRMQTVVRVILPAALPAIVTGVFLAVGRIAGETAPVLLTAGNSDYWPTGPADQTPFLPVYIYKYSTSPYPEWQRLAWGGALVLLAVVMFLNVGIRLLAGKRMVAASRAD